MRFFYDLVDYINLSRKRKKLIKYFIDENIITDEDEIKIFKDKFSYIYAIGDYIIERKKNKIEREFKILLKKKDFQLSQESLAEFSFIINYIYQLLAEENGKLTNTELYYFGEIGEKWIRVYFSRTIGGLDPNGVIDEKAIVAVKSLRYPLYTDFILGKDPKVRQNALDKISSLHSLVKVSIPLITNESIRTIQGTYKIYFREHIESILYGYKDWRNIIYRLFNKI